MNERPSSLDSRARVIGVTVDLLRSEGVGAVTTRRVADLSGLQAPAIYRLFGDKDGLLEAVAEHVLAEFVDAKGAVVDAATETDLDPVEDLRAGWSQQLEFGLSNPGLFRLLSDPSRYATSPAARSGRAVLAARVHRVAVAGRLRVAEPRAVALIQSSGIGVVTTLLATPSTERDAGLAEAAFDAVLASILTGGAPPTDGPPASDDSTSSVVAVRARAASLPGLSVAERALLSEWLDRTLEIPAAEGID